MRAFAIIAVLITLLVTVYLITRDTASRMSEKENHLKITAIEKARQTEKKIDRSNAAAQKKLKEIQSE